MNENISYNISKSTVNNCIITNDQNIYIFTGELLCAKSYLREVFESYIDTANDYGDDTDEYITTLRVMETVDFSNIENVQQFLISINLQLI